MKANFLCHKHREELNHHPEYAVGIWLKLINAARTRVSKGEWNEAAMLYGNAFEAAGILLDKQTSDHEVNRFIMTATEFAYALRQCSYPSDLQILVAIAREQLEKSLYPAETSLLLRPLTDVAFSPLSEVNQCMETLYTQAKPPQHTEASTVH